MEKFNLERALAGDPVVTRDGRKVNEIHYFKSDESNYPIIAIIDGTKYSYTKKGEYGLAGDDNLDLFMAPKIIEKWVNVFYKEDGHEPLLVGHHGYDSEEEAKHYGIGTSFYLKTIKITNEK